MTESKTILVINPNSSESMTNALRQNLGKVCPPGSDLEFLTGSPSGPPSINDPSTSIQSAYDIYFNLLTKDNRFLSKLSSEGHSDQTISAVLVCCFSDHPLVPILRHAYPHLTSSHILETSLAAALSTSLNGSFGILTTGQDMVPDIDRGVYNFLGAPSFKYKGCLATNLGVLQLQDSSQKAHVEKIVMEKAGELAQRGIGAIILGCAGMTGMESLVRKGAQNVVGFEVASKIAVIDGAIAGVNLLSGLARCNFTG